MRIARLHSQPLNSPLFPRNMAPSSAPFPNHLQESSNPDEMQTYTDEQLAQYLTHIGYPHDARQQVAEDPLGCLTTLQRRHMARVPFESLSLHYSRHRTLSLDPEDLFNKIVTNGRGGYCMEVNTFFAVVLRTLGFAFFSVGGRVKSPIGYKGW